MRTVINFVLILSLLLGTVSTAHASGSAAGAASLQLSFSAANGDVATASYTASGDENVFLALAGYMGEGSRRTLSSLTCRSFDAKSGLNEFTLNHKDYLATEVKAMLWSDSGNALVPLCKSESVSHIGNETVKYIPFGVALSYNSVPKGNVIEQCTENGNSYLHFERTVNASDSFIDIPLNSSEREIVANSIAYVAECDIRIIENDYGIEVLSAKSTEDEWYVNNIWRSGSITWGGNLEQGSWHRLSVVYDRAAAVRSTYIDGKLKAATPYTNVFTPSLYRIGAITGEGKVVFDIDNFRIYGANGLKPNESEDTQMDKYSEFASAMETPADAAATVNDSDVVLMVANGSYLTGGVKRQSSEPPYFKDGVVMVALSFLEEAFALDCTYDTQSGEISVDDKLTMTLNSACAHSSSACTLQAAPELSQGSVYVPLVDVCTLALGKQSYYDGRGFVVISDEEFTLRNSESVQILDEPIDTLYRYLQFERPTGAQIIADIKEHSPGKTHPRILGTAADMERMKENVQKDELMALWADATIKSADVHCTEEPPVYKLNNALPPTILSQSRTMLKRMLNLSVAYVLTDNTKYFDAAWNNVEHVCNTYPNWNDYQHFLDTGEMSYAFAICYDMFYDLLSAEQKQLMRQTLVKNAFERGLVAYSGIHPNGYWINGDDNWTSVCPGGLMSAAVAVCDEDGMDEICSLILGQTVQSFEYIMSLFYEDGAWYESVNYLEYTMEYMCAGLGSLVNASGKTYGFFEAPGVDNILNCTISMHGPAGGAFNYHDGNPGLCIHPTHLWLAKLLKQYAFYNDYLMLKEKFAGLNVADARLLLYYDPDNASQAQAFPLDSYFRQAEVGVMRQNSSADSLWAAVHAGRNGIDHDHLDLGVFEFDALGVRWAYELGADSYNIPGYFGLNGYNLYRKRPEGHNCIVINPRENYQGQSIKCSTTLERMDSKPRGAITVFDLTNAYIADASKAQRGYMLSDDRRAFVVRDELELLEENNEIYWFMHTRAEVETDGKTAVLTQNGKTLTLSVATDAHDYEISVMQAVPLPTSPVVEGMADDSGKHKIAIKFKAGKSVGITVKLVPQTVSSADISPADNTPIAQWTIADGEIE